MILALLRFFGDVLDWGDKRLARMRAGVCKKILSRAWGLVSHCVACLGELVVDVVEVVLDWSLVWRDRLLSLDWIDAMLYAILALLLIVLFQGVRGI